MRSASKQELIGTKPPGTENTSFGKAGGVPFIDPLRYCLRLRFAKKVLALHFERKEDLEAACNALEALDVLLFQQKPLHETWLAVNTYLYGGALEYGPFQPKPLSTREVCRKLKRKGLSERTVRRYLQPLRPRMAAVQTALARGHLLPEDKKARDTYLGDLIVNAWKRRMGLPSARPPRQ